MTGRTRAAATSAALLLALGALTGCGGEDDTAVENVEEIGAGELVVGEVVTIEGEVQEFITLEAFTVGEDETLVFGADDTMGIEEGDEVVVTGEVVEFVLADIEPQFDLDLDEGLFVDYENELAVAATEVEEQ